MCVGGGGVNIKTKSIKMGGAEEGGSDFYLKKHIKREGGREEKRIVPGIFMDCPFHL